MAVPAEHHDAFKTLIQDMVAAEVSKSPIGMNDLQLRIYEQLRQSAQSIIGPHVMVETDPEVNGKYELDRGMRVATRTKTA